MKWMLAAVAFVALGAAQAEAAPVAYACEASGGGGALTFGLSIDAEARQVTTSWSGAHPFRADETFSESADLLSITGDVVSATFRKAGYAYVVRLERGSGDVRVSFPRDGSVVESVGSCGEG